MIRLLIVSDIRIYREGLARILDSKDQVNIVASASDAKEAINTIQSHSPDIVLFDLTMIDSMRTVTDIMTLCPNTKIVVLAITEDEGNIHACAEAGIAGYVAREASLEELLNTLHGAINGELYCPPRIAAKLMSKIKSLAYPSKNHDDNNKSFESVIARLTQREKQIAQLVSDGCSNKQIARNLNIEVSTVKNHVHNILVKMGVDSRLQAASIFQK